MTRIGVLPAVHVCAHVCALCPQEAKREVSDPLRRVMDSCEVECGCWESNTGSLGKQVLLTVEPSIQSLLSHLNATFFFSKTVFKIICECTHTHIKVINQSAGVSPLLPNTWILGFELSSQGLAASKCLPHQLSNLARP